MDMSFLFEQIDAWVTIMLLATWMVAAWAVGRQMGHRRAIAAPEPMGNRFIDASLALLGLLLAFTFSMSLARHEHRRAMVVADSNSIGDFYTCASLLKDPARSKLQALIREYAQSKYEAAQRPLSEAALQSFLQRFQQSHARMTELVIQAAAEGTPILIPLTNTLNNLTSSSASRVNAFRDRLPWSIVLLLCLGAVVSMFLIGRGQAGCPEPQIIITSSFVLLVCLVVYVTLDLNQPGHGLITVSQEPFERLLIAIAK
jgi:hypothetical protein